MNKRAEAMDLVHDDARSSAPWRWKAWRAWYRRWWARALRRWHTSWRPVALHLHCPPDGKGHELAAALDAFDNWCKANQGAVCALGLSSRWLLLDAVPSTSASSPTTTEAVRDTVVQRWGRYHDVDEADFGQRWVYREAQPAGATLACAAPHDLIHGLQSHARKQGVRLTAVQPWWAQAVEAWMARAVPATEPGQPWRLQLHEPGLVTHVDLMAREDGTPAWQAVWVGPDAGTDTTETERRGAVWHVDPFVHAQALGSAQTPDGLLWALPQSLGAEAWQEAA